MFVKCWLLYTIMPSAPRLDIIAEQCYFRGDLQNITRLAQFPICIIEVIANNQNSSEISENNHYMKYIWWYNT